MISVHLENGSVEVCDAPQPIRPESFALIRLLAAGICNTDLELQRGYYGFSGTPGHEFVDIAAQAPATPEPGCSITLKGGPDNEP